MSKIISAIFPVFWVLLFFACVNWKLFRKSNNTLWLLLVFSAEALALRILMIIAGVRFAKRYAYVLVMLVILFSVAGLPLVVRLCHSLLAKKTKRLTPAAISLILIPVAIGACLGKALRPQNDKQWMWQVAELVRAETNGETSLMISDLNDVRIAYYAKSKYLMFGTEDKSQPAIHMIRADGTLNTLDREPGLLAKQGRDRYAGAMLLVDGSPGLKHLAENIRKQGYTENFVLLRMEDSTVRELFSAKAIPFPLKLIKVFHDHKKRAITLYRLKDRE